MFSRAVQLHVSFSVNSILPPVFSMYFSLPLPPPTFLYHPSPLLLSSFLLPSAPPPFHPPSSPNTPPLSFFPPSHPPFPSVLQFIISWPFFFSRRTTEDHIPCVPECLRRPVCCLYTWKAAGLQTNILSHIFISKNLIHTVPLPFTSECYRKV